MMEGVVNWTILIGNRGAAHGSLQAVQPAIRRIVACSPQHDSELAGPAIKTWGAGTEPSPKIPPRDSTTPIAISQRSCSG
jgi:hypothetical protein